MTKILLVEDDSAIIENLRAVLKAEGFWVQAEAGQKEALEAPLFDFILLCKLLYTDVYDRLSYQNKFGTTEKNV